MDKKYYIIGLPDSGKSTFLAALGYYLLSGENENSIYRLGENNNLEYISDLAYKWSKCEELDRTNISVTINVSLQLIDRDENIIDIIMPDRSGESFRNIIKNREIEDKMFDEISNSNEILLFINPSKISNDSFLYEIPSIYRTQSRKKIEIKNPYNMHEQAEYVELLQCVGKLLGDHIRLKILVSAWDEYDSAKFPEELLKEKLPLLWQYLNTNRILFDCEFWGISAQGGNLNNVDKKKELEEHINACERIIVVDENGDISNDISKILK